MKLGWNGGIGLLVAAWAFGHPQGASAQYAPIGSGGQTSAVPPAAMMMNPYLNPYLNPYINPSAPQQRMTPGTAALYLYSAQSAGGGIGSGRMSGTRGPAASPAPRKAADVPNSSAVPGSGAARFFNPGPVNVNGAGRYYNRRNPYFQSNAR